MSDSSHHDDEPRGEWSRESSKEPQGRGARRGRRGRADSKNDPSKNGRKVIISKAMSFILRHGAQKEGLRLDERGYARVDELVHLSSGFFFIFFYGFGVTFLTLSLPAMDSRR